MAALLAVALTLSTPTSPLSSVHQQAAGCPPIIEAYFGDRAPAACRVAWCESRWDFYAVSPGGANIGLFQINRIHGWHASFDPDTNVAYAYELSRGGTYWGPWACKP